MNADYIQKAKEHYSATPTGTLIIMHRSLSGNTPDQDGEDAEAIQMLISLIEDELKSRKVSLYEPARYESRDPYAHLTGEPKSESYSYYQKG